MYFLEELSEFLVDHLFFFYIDIIMNKNIMEHLQSTKL